MLYKTKLNHENETVNGQRKTTSLLFTVILEGTLHKEGLGKEWRKSGKNELNFRQEAKVW